MPFLVAAAIVGAGVFGAYRILSSALAEAERMREAAGKQPAADATTSANDAPAKDLGTFERDPATGVWREPGGDQKH